MNVTDTAGATLNQTYTLTVRKAATRVKLSVPSHRIHPGELLLLRIIVSPVGTTAVAQVGVGSEAAPDSTVAATSPTGLVVIKEGTKQLGVMTLSAGSQAVFRTRTLSVGKHVISVSYRGSRTYAPSNSSINVTVDARVGPEFRINTVTARAQEMPAIARLADRGLCRRLAIEFGGRIRMGHFRPALQGGW